MTEAQAISTLINSKFYIDVFSDLDNWKILYKEYAKLLHPDKCKDPAANEAIRKLNLFKDELDKGKKHKDDAGIITYTLKECELIGSIDLIDKSLKNYNILMSLSDESSKHFKKYLPSNMIKNSSNELKFTMPARAVPLSSIGVIDQKHVNWILSRMFEFISWINQIGYSHNGINPDSIYIIPENHGMICASFYHMTRLSTKLDTVSGRYANFYPSSIFTEKQTIPLIDIELAKRTAVYLLGDKSGVGVLLRKTHNNDVIDFLQKQHTKTFDTFREYRKLLEKHFNIKEFNELKV
jgi:hypothetical protein